jgi:hypothetical protein
MFKTNSFVSCIFLCVLVGGVKEIITVGGKKLTGEQKLIGAAFTPSLELTVVTKITSLGESKR